MVYRVGIIGTGVDPKTKSRDGYAMAYRHAPGYRRLDDCELVACADIIPEHAASFASHFELDDWFDSHIEMLEGVDLDIVSICVPPSAHAELVLDCATHGDLQAIHCEKPMATSWGACREMVDTCADNDVQLTINHQRRLSIPVQEAKARIDGGMIGPIRRLEWSEVNLFDAGSHLFDLCDHLTDGATPAWALAAVDLDPDNRWFGAINDAHGIATWGYTNGVLGLASTAEESDQTVVDPYLRIVGEDGIIEIQHPDGPPLRIDTGDGWQTIDTNGETVYRPSSSLAAAATYKLIKNIPGMSGNWIGEPSHYERAIEHVVSGIRDGIEPVISGRRVIRGTELIFACYESASRRERVDLPLTIEGNPLDRMLSEKFPEEMTSASD